MHLIYSRLRDTVVQETNFVGEHHFRCLTVSFRGLGLRVSAPRTFILHRLGLIFGGDLIFTVRKLVGGWKASNLAEKPTFWSKVVQHESGKEKNQRGFTETGLTLCTRGIKI